MGGFVVKNIGMIPSGRKIDQREIEMILPADRVRVQEMLHEQRSVEDDPDR